MRKWIVFFLLFALTVWGCSDLPHDWGDPAHARYVASGRKDADRKLWWAALLVCQSLVEPILEQKRLECGQRPNCAYEIGSPQHAYLVIECADGITSYGPGSRGKDEFDTPIDIPM